MKNKNLLLRMLPVALLLLLVLALSGCGNSQNAQLTQLALLEAPYGQQLPTAVGYYGAPLSTYKLSGTAVVAGSQKEVAGAWQFADDQRGGSAAALVPEVGTAYTAIFIPESGAENYSVLTADIVPEILNSTPTYRELTASDVNALITGELVMDDMELAQGTIYPSGTLSWLDEAGTPVDGTSPLKKGAVYTWQFVADGSDGLIGIDKGWMMEGRVTLWPSFIAGESREAHGNIPYRVYVPDGYVPGENVPVYMYLHGCGGTIGSALQYTGIDDLAQEHNFLVVMPQQSEQNSKNKCWNWFKSSPTTAGNVARLGGEPESLVAILRDVCTDFSVDEEKIFVGGLSAGGYMANIMAATYPDVFSGVMINAGGAYFTGRTYNEAIGQMDVGAESASGQSIAQLADEIWAQMGENARVVPMVVVQGTADTTVCPQNGLDAAQCWAEVLHRIDENISTQPQITNGEANGGTYTLYTYYDEVHGEPVIQLYMVDGLRHMFATAMMKSPNAVEVSYRFFLDR